ncbi:hypothetical protein [Pseudoalteromonas aurantia]|nr:hypothetical protein [Pseudoalteromonas aurantia]
MKVIQTVQCKKISAAGPWKEPPRTTADLIIQAIPWKPIQTKLK